MTHKGSGRQRGFTLVEMLVVVTMLGIISAVAIVSLGEFGNASAEATCAADAKSLASAEDAALASNGVYATEAQLVTSKFLRDEISSYDISLGAGAKSYTLVPVTDCTSYGLVGVSTLVPPASTTTPSGTTTSTTTSTSTTTTTTTTTTPTTTTSPDTTPPNVTIASCTVGSNGKWGASGGRGTAAGDLPLVTITIAGPTPDSGTSSSGGAIWTGNGKKLNAGTYTCAATQSDSAGNSKTVTRQLVVS